MFNFKSKLCPDLSDTLDKNIYKNIRIIICCKTLQQKIENKIKFYKGKILFSIDSIKCICAIVPASSINKLLEYPNIDYIFLDSYAFLCGKSVFSANKIPLEKNYKLTGKNIGIGIIDSGTYPHMDFITPKNRISKFVDLVNHYKYPYDDNGHGTSVSGIICSNGYSSKGIYKGIAQDSYLYCIKAFNNIGRGFISDILYALSILIEDSDKFNIKVICLPFEVLNNNKKLISLFNNLFSIAVSKNITIIVPSGHNGNNFNSMKGIALLDTCITVGGLNIDKEIKPYTNSSAGPNFKLNKPDVSAACVDIVSTNTNVNYISERNGRKLYPKILEEPYSNFTGTSYAAAYVAGLCALLYENNSSLNLKDIKALLKVSSELQDIPKDIQGHGILNLSKLLPNYLK
ncbi:MAG: S8 family serine peptidase [Clostridium cochlearium]|uniref:S8 family peptidase n=1 Tax=Clostridium cochlearium TaxID=1494 RepID=UPI002149A84C|nr:S8 family serine peptidase [Clostridium cochlearium]MBE6065605.1 peptidase [Clostridium cochlearium]MCR1972068.1 S8 family serine peptidase [Clostridium cochlearium]MDU1442883.1 S8 family serine peptidase [Clostridium cochlearium]